MDKAAVAPVVSTFSLLPPAQDMLQRRCTCGNHTVAGACAECSKKNGIMQRKFAIDASNDPLELEADQIADQALNARVHSAVSNAPPRIQRYADPATKGADIAPASVGMVLSGTGRSLEPALRQDMEQRFSHDFSQVRVHSGGAAEQSARDVNANAYTVGQDIVFGGGRFAPEMQEGRRLLAHELAHVVQNRGRPASESDLLSREPATKTPAQPEPAPTNADNVPLKWTWKDLAVYPLLVDIWKDLVLKELTPGDRKLLALKGTEGAAFYAWAMAVGLMPGGMAGGDKPKDAGDYLKNLSKYADSLTGLTPAKDAILDPLSRIVGLRVDDYLSSDLFLTRVKTHTATLAALFLAVQGTYSLIQGVKKKNEDPTALEGDAWTQQTGLIKALVNAIFKKQLKAPDFFDVGPMQLATHPAFSAAPFAGGGVPSGAIFELNQDVSGEVRQQKYGLTLNLPALIKPGGATVSDIADPSKYRGWQGSAWFTYEANKPLTLTPDKQPGYKFKGGTIFGSAGHLAELEAGAQYGGETGKELTSWFVRGGYGYVAGEKATGLRKIGFTATYLDWKEQDVIAPLGTSGVPAGGWGLKTTPFASTRFNVGTNKTLDASAAISFVTGRVGETSRSGFSDFSLGLSYTYMGDSAPDKLPAFKLDLTGSVSRLDWWNPDSPLLWGGQAKVNVGPVFGGVNVMTGAGSIPESRLDRIGPTVKTMVPTTLLITGGVVF